MYISTGKMYTSEREFVFSHVTVSLPPSGGNSQRSLNRLHERGHRRSYFTNPGSSCEPFSHRQSECSQCGSSDNRLCLSLDRLEMTSVLELNGPPNILALTVMRQCFICSSTFVRHGLLFTCLKFLLYCNTKHRQTN